MDEDEADEIAGSIDFDESDFEGLIGGTIASRAASYAMSAYATFENNRAQQARDVGVTFGRRDCLSDGASCSTCPELATPEGEYIPIDDITEVGDDGECNSNCRCEISFAEAEGFDVNEADLGEHEAVFSEAHREARFGPGGILGR